MTRAEIQVQPQRAQRHKEKKRKILAFFAPWRLNLRNIINKKIRVCPRLSASNFFLWAIVLLLLTACATSTPRPPAHLTLVGADSMQWLAYALSQAYTQQHPNVTFTIQLADTAAGLSAASTYSNTLGLASRQVKSSELNGTRAMPIARDGIAILVNRANPINAIMRSQIAEIFTGQIAAWPLGPNAGQPIVVMSREDGSGTRDAFEALVMGDQRVTRAAIVMPGEAAMVDYVARHPEAIGYSSMGAVTPDVRALIVDDIPLNQQNVENKKYPLIRTLSFIVPLTPDFELQEFIAFATGAEGQKIVTQKFGKAP